jgi:REP element-mobilizing transposase RayT
MPRPPRSYTSGIYHLASHGSDDRCLFDDDDDRTAFLDRLGLTFSCLGIELISYVLMSNHYHALAYTPDGRLARGLQRVHGGYSYERNRLRSRRAHLFRAHCIARRIIGNDDLVTVSRYLAFNPVAAGLVLDPTDWPWGSARAHAGVGKAPIHLVERHLEAVFGPDPTWRKRYRRFLDDALAPTAEGRDEWT